MALVLHSANWKLQANLQTNLHSGLTNLWNFQISRYYFMLWYFSLGPSFFSFLWRQKLFPVGERSQFKRIKTSE